MPEVVASADIAFALAYYAMAAVPIYIARRRPDFPLSSLTALFVASLLACGASRFIDVGTAWSATDSWVAVSRIASAALALLSAILLWSLIPRILALPTALTQRTRPAPREGQSSGRAGGTGCRLCIDRPQREHRSDE